MYSEIRGIMLHYSTKLCELQQEITSVELATIILANYC